MGKAFLRSQEALSFPPKSVGWEPPLNGGPSVDFMSKNHTSYIVSPSAKLFKVGPSSSTANVTPTKNLQIPSNCNQVKRRVDISLHKSHQPQLRLRHKTVKVNLQIPFTISPPPLALISCRPPLCTRTDRDVFLTPENTRRICPPRTSSSYSSSCY